MTLVQRVREKWKACVPYLSSLLFGVSARVHLKGCESMDDFGAMLSSKKRRDLKRILRKDCAAFRSVPGQLRPEYISLLWTFIQRKYSDRHFVVRLAHWILGVAFLCSGILNFVEYHSTTCKKGVSTLCGWSSYFILNDVLYDFISAPVQVPISVIGMQSLKHCIANKIPVLDMGPTQLELKQRKFGCVLYDALNHVYF